MPCRGVVNPGSNRAVGESSGQASCALLCEQAPAAAAFVPKAGQEEIGGQDRRTSEEAEHCEREPGPTKRRNLGPLPRAPEDLGGYA